MRLLLLSNSTMPGEPYLGWPRTHITEFLAASGSARKRIAFVPFAAVSFSMDEYARITQGAFAEMGHELFSLHTETDKVKALDSADALAWRLARPGMIGWGVGLVAFAVVMGSLADVFETVADSPDLAERFRRMGAGAADLRLAFFVAMLGILVVLVAIWALQLVEHIRKEEESGRAEAVLATATSRARYLGAHVVPAVVVPTLVLAAIGVLRAARRTPPAAIGPDAGIAEPAGPHA